MLQSVHEEGLLRSLFAMQGRPEFSDIRKWLHDSRDTIRKSLETERDTIALHQLQGAAQAIDRLFAAFKAAETYAAQQRR